MKVSKDNKAMFNAIMREITALRCASTAESLVTRYRHAVWHLSVYADECEYYSDEIWEYLSYKVDRVYQETKAQRGYQF